MQKCMPLYILVYGKDDIFLTYENNLTKDEETITIFQYIFDQMNSRETNEDNIKQYKAKSLLRCNFFRPTVASKDYLTVSLKLKKLVKVEYLQ